MANDKKFVVKNGLQTQNIDHLSPNRLNTITNEISDSDVLSWTGDAGELFRITDTATGALLEVFDGSNVIFEVNSNGDISALNGGAFIGNITGDVTGNADTATALETARTISLTGDATGSVAFDGTGNVSITTTVSGGSGGDAATLDGLDSTEFLRSNADDSFTGTIIGAGDGTNPALRLTGTGPNFIRFEHNTGPDATTIDLIYRTTGNTLGFERSSDATVFWNTDGDTGVTNFQFAPTVNNNRILTVADEGSGNGLDADTLDGIQGSNYARTDIAETFTQNVIITGDLTVNGTTTTVNSNTVNIGDNIIVLNADETGTPSQDGGIEIERGTSTNVSFIWDEANDRWSTVGQDLAASTFIGTLSGNATTASTLQTARTISLGGDLSGSASFNGGSNITINATVDSVAANSIALGTDTTGNYVSTVTGTANEIEVTGSGSESAAVTIGLPDDVTITGQLTVGTDIVPAADNTGNVGNASFTWNNGRFTNLTVDSTITVRGAIDLADNDALRFGSSDDFRMFYDGTNNLLEMELEAASTALVITDNTTERFRFTKTDGFLGINESAPIAYLHISEDAAGQAAGAVPMLILESFDSTGTEDVVAGIGPAIDFYVPDATGSLLSRSQVSGRIATLRTSPTDNIGSGAMVFYTAENAQSLVESFRINPDTTLNLSTDTLEFGSTAGFIRSVGSIVISADTDADEAASSINFEIDGTEMWDITNNGYLRVNSESGPANAGISSQASDGILRLAGGGNALNDGINMSLSGSTRSVTTPFAIRYNTDTLLSYNDTSDLWFFNSAIVEFENTTSVRRGTTPIPAITVADAPSGTPQEGDFWYNTDNGSLYVYYTDATPDSYWVEAGGNTGQGTSGAGGSSPFIDTGTFVYYGGPRNVGIGTATPSEALEVIGNVLASEDVIAYSDERLKENINTIDSPINIIENLRGVRYDKKSTSRTSIGVIAQEVQDILPELVHVDPETGYLSVAYGNMAGVFIEAIKEQQQEINDLKKTVAMLIERLDKLDGN